MTDTPTFEWNDILTKLQDFPEMISWCERRNVVRELATALTGGDRSEPVMQLVELLAYDPKWEVRTDVAGLLYLLPDDRFVRTAVVLSEDGNVFVRNAAERALDRRRRGHREARRVKHGLDQLRSECAIAERLYGHKAAKMIHGAAECLFEHLVSATVHEMRAVLTPLKSHTLSLLHHIKDGTVDPDEAYRKLVKVTERLAFLGRIVDDMRTYSQLLPTERRRERLSELAGQAVAMVRENLEAGGHRHKNISVQMAIPEHITLDVSRHHILMAFGNVIKNAFESFVDTEQNLGTGSIYIGAQLINEDSVEIVIQDTGMGMSDQDLEEIRLFIPGKTSKRNKGTGFGLPIARRNVQSHGGALDIESREYEGTKVTIMLPLEQPEANTYAVQSSRN